MRVWINGRICPDDQAKVSALDAGLLVGDGVFETLRTHGRSPVLLREHLDRLAAGLAEINLECPYDIASAVRELLDASTDSQCSVGEGAPAGPDDVTIRITVTRGTSEQGPTAMVTAGPLRTFAGDYALETVAAFPRSFPPPWVKSTSYAGFLHARRMVTADDALLVHGDSVLETTTANIFAVFGNVLVTPPASLCLPGVTRASVLELASDTGLELDEGLALPGLIHADEAFVTNSLVGVMPVSRVDGRHYPVPGGTTAMLAARYTEAARKC